MPLLQTEFSYKLKPKSAGAQFKLAETNGIPFAVILGEDEQAQGKVRIKEMGALGPEKDGVLVNLKDLVLEMKVRLESKEKTGDVGDITATTSTLSLEATKEDSKVGTTIDDGV